MKTFFFFFLESTCALCPWSLASSIPVLGLESVCPRKGCPWPWPWPRIFFLSLALALASSLVSSTPPLFYDAAKAGVKPSLKHAKQQKLNSITIMADKIDIDARKNFKKPRTNQPENRQILKTANLNSTFTAVLKKKNVRKPRSAKHKHQSL